MEADERETFAELVGHFCALYEEQTLIDDGSEGAVKLFRFQRRAPGTAEDPPAGEAAP